MAGNAKTDRQLIASSIALVVVGIVLLIVGSALKSHYQLNAAVCNTYGGPTESCAGNEGIFTLGQVLQPLGGFLLAVGLLGSIIMVVTKATGANKTALAPKGARASSGESRPNETLRAPNGSAPVVAEASSEVTGTEVQPDDW
jgi:hypothetical protein